MNNATKDNDAYKNLCQSVSDNTNLHILHFGSSKKDVEEILKNNSDESLTFSSPFSKDNRPISFYYEHEKILEGQEFKSETLFGVKIEIDERAIEFSINNPSHDLNGIIIKNELPKVIAKPGYKVAWCHNVGSNICPYGVFTHSNVLIHSFDNKTSDILLASPQRGEDIDSINLDIGNTYDLQSFSNILPQKPVIFIPSHPFNSNDTSDYFPLYLCSKHDLIKVAYIFKKDPQSLLIIAEEKEDGTLQIIIPEKNKRYVNFYLNGSEVTEFSYPTTLCHYSYKSPLEIDSNWHNYKTNSNDNEPPHIAFYVNQAISFKVENPILNGTTAIEKINTPHNVTLIAWMAEHVDSCERHIYSNYTSNTSPDFLGSISPIVSTTISTGKVTILDDIPGIATTRMIPRFTNRKSPNLPGIHIRSLGIRNCDNTIKPGFKFEDGYIKFTLKENDPLVFDGSRPKNNELYNIHARLFTRIPFGFSLFCSNQDQRDKKEKSIVNQLSQ